MFDAWMQVSEDQLSGGIKTKNKNVNDLLNSLSMKIISEIPVIRSQITWWDALTSSIADVGPASLEIMWQNIKINYPHFAATTIKITFLQKYCTSFQTNIGFTHSAFYCNSYQFCLLVHEERTGYQRNTTISYNPIESCMSKINFLACMSFYYNLKRCFMTCSRKEGKTTTFSSAHRW